MLMKIRRELVVGGVIAMLTVAILTTGTMFAQSATPTPASGAMPAGDQTGMMDMASPAADAAPMDQMMEQCMAMMMDMMMAMMMGDGEMSGMMGTPGAGMNGMMGEGDMSGMMGDGMSGMMASPAADASMGQMMEQCMAMMMDMMGDGEMSGMMGTPVSGT